MKQLQRLTFAAMACFAMPALAADHLDSPSVEADGSTDILDFYAFMTPGDDSKITMIMTVSPFAGADATFSDAADYTFWLSAGDDSLYAVNCTFTGATFNCDAGNGIAAAGNIGMRADGDLISAWAGLADDPFFFDLLGFQNAVGANDDAKPFCVLDPDGGGNGDTFAGSNVNGIVIELGTAAFVADDDPVLAVWVTTSRQGG